MNIITIYFVSYFMFTWATEGTKTHENETLSSDNRQPRVNGRIVKLYTGTRPEPFFCTGEGFQPDKTNCAVFYRCVRGLHGKYSVFRYQCGPGTVYDPDTEICNHPQNTKRSECGGRIISSTEHNRENEIWAQAEVSQSFNTKYPFHTEHMSITNAPVSTLNPWTTSPKHQYSEASSITASDPWGTTLGTSEHSVPLKDNSNYPSSHQGDACTSDGFMGDSENCRKFYRCVGNQRGGFIKYEFSCSESTVWDEDAQSCNHPWAVRRRRCGRGNSYDEKPSNKDEQILNHTQTTIQQQLQINYGSKISQTQIQISKEPVIQNQTQMNYGDRLNHKQNSNVVQNQTQISYGSAISQSQTQINYGNKGIQTQLQVDHTKEASQTQNQVYHDSTTKSTTAVTSQYEINESTLHPQNSQQSDYMGGQIIECTESGFMGDKNDCRKFYRCVSNGKGSFARYEFACGEGTVWDAQIEACNHAWAVKECGGKTPAMESSHSESPITTTDGTITTKATTQNHIGETQTQQTSSTASTVQFTSTAPITTASNSETICTSSGFIGDSNDCKKFYRCVDNGKGSYTKYEYNCGEGTVWDQDIEACNHPWAVKKCGASSDINKVDTTTTTEMSVMTTVSLVQTTTQASQNIDNGSNEQQQIGISTTTATTKKPKDSKCKSDGFMGDINDCKKFYRCVDNGNGVYTRYEFTCGEGTVWDSKIEACNHAWAVEDCAGADTSGIHKETSSTNSQTVSDEEVSEVSTVQHDSSLSSSTTTVSTMASENDKCHASGFIGDKNDCKKFYRCVDDGKGGFIRYEFSCGEGTIWDQSIEGCNHAWAVKICGKEEIETTSESYSSSALTTNRETQDYNQGNQESSEKTTTITTPSESSNYVCMKEGFVGDSTDCKKFYRCVDNQRGSYIKYEFTCGEGTVWDPEISACNHQTSDTNCVKNGNFSPPKETDPENDETDMSSSTSTSTGQGELISSSQKPQVANNICTDEGFYGYSDDCRKFYRCVNNGKGYTKYDFTCGDGTIWDQEIQACNHESSNNNCSNSSGISDIESSTRDNEEHSSTTPSSTLEQQPTQKNPDSDASHTSSNSQCKSEGFFANTNDCKKFYRCVDNGKGGYTKYEFTCGDGTIWVQEIQACDHDNDVKRCNSQIDSTSQEVITDRSTTPYTSTSESQSPNKENDEYPNDTSNAPAISNKDECSSEGFYGNEVDCRRFYRCVDNGRGGYEKYDFTCGDGTAWDSDLQTCNHINEVKSCQETSQQQNNTNNMTQNDETSPTTNDSGTTKTTTSSTTESSKPASSATCDQEGYYGNTEDCKKFYRCVDDGKGSFTKYDFTCGEGTIWDKDITTCNHPEDVTNPSCKKKDDSTTSDSNSSSSSETTPDTSNNNNDTNSSSSSSSSEATSTTSNNNNEGDCSSTKPVNKNVTCTKAGYYADPNDCKKFYRCVDWDGDGKRFSVYHFDCGEGTIWDPALDTCNHEDSVYPPRDCSGTQSQNENVSQESTTTEKTTTSQETNQQSTTENGSTTESTTQESTTNEQSTTQQSTTSEQTTTQQSTTSEKTTTQQSTTSEKTTTQQSTTKEQTTTQQSTTDEQTPTQQSSTSQQTTTQQSTTKEQTTTQQPTTSEQTTTQQSTTTEQTTTQESTMSEDTTTQQSTTERQTTTSKSSSTEQTTTQEMSTTDQTTTQESTTSEDTTTQESSTTEQTTTQQSTTNEENTTEQSSTTDQSTTQQSTTDGETQQSSTTEQTTTTENIDQISSTEQSSQESTTEESTSATSQQTEETTTSKSTEESTTEGEQSTTESSSSTNKDCPETDDDQHLFVCPTSFKRHPKYCNLFYQCDEDDESHEVKIAVFNCPNNTIYDESKIKCVEESKADKKCDGEIAQRRRVKRLDTTYKEPIIVSKESLKCTTVGYFPFEKEECSPAFLKCYKSKLGKLRGLVYQCPEGFVYWSVSRRCEAKANVRFCNQSYNSWKGRWEIPIERKNVAK